MAAAWTMPPLRRANKPYAENLNADVVMMKSAEYRLRRSNTVFVFAVPTLDCFAEPVIGRRFAPIRRRAMRVQRAPGIPHPLSFEASVHARLRRFASRGRGLASDVDRDDRIVGMSPRRTWPLLGTVPAQRLPALP
jgi:hypothetical protein